MEKVFLMGEKRNLVGILSQSDSAKTGEEKPFILMLNSGLVHRPGPFRMNTEFAMLLAEQGFSSFRFDLSGIGDSEKQAMDSMLYKDRNLSDVGEAIDFIVEKVNPARIIVMGLCTGADLAHRSAAKYDEISGSILLDGYGYPTQQFYLKRYAPLLMNPVRLLAAVRRIVKRILPLDSADNLGESGVDAYYWELPDKSDYIADMNAMHQAGKKHFYAYTSGVSEYYNYEQQFFDSFKGEDFCSDVKVHFFNGSDHTYILHQQRMYLFDAMLEWINDV